MYSSVIPHAVCWILQTDPFCSVSQLSEEDKETARNQSIPSLDQLLKLAKQHNISVIFDLYSPDQERDTNETVSIILRSGIDPKLVSLNEIELHDIDRGISWWHI